MADMTIHPLRNFRKLATLGAPLLAPAVREIMLQTDLWQLHTERQSFAGSAHHDTEVIYLRGPSEFTAESYFSVDTVDFSEEQQALPACKDLMWRMFGLLVPYMAKPYDIQCGRCLIVRLKPNGEIDEHRDEGAYAEHFQRVHLALFAENHDYLACGDEAVTMQQGELWWFNHHLVHSGENMGVNWRIHMILDYRP